MKDANREDRYCTLKGFIHQICSISVMKLANQIFVEGRLSPWRSQGPMVGRLLRQRKL